MTDTDTATDDHGFVRLPTPVAICSVCGESFLATVLEADLGPQPDDDGLYCDESGHVRHVCRPEEGDEAELYAAL